MTKANTMTLDFYNQNAEAFFNNTIQVDMSELYAPFLMRLPPQGCILDAGCGSGRDAKAFADLGFRVQAMDASIELVKLARQYTGLEVRHQNLESINEQEAFHGIWACASLLHLPMASLPRVFQQFAAALKPGGLWYLSFKYGQGERTKDGRNFTDLNEQGLAQLLSQCPSLSLVEQWITLDKRPDRDEQWLNALLVRG